MFPFACVCAWGCLRHLTRPIRTVQPRSKRERNSTRWRLPSHENQTPSQLEGEVPVLARGTLGALAANLAADAERSGNAALCTQLRRFAVSGGGGPVREAVFSGMDGPTCVTQLRAWCGPDDAAFLELATKLKLKDCTWMLLSALPCGGCVGSRHCFVVLSILRDLSLFFGAQIPPLRLLPSPMPPAFAPTLRHTQSIYRKSCLLWRVSEGACGHTQRCVVPLDCTRRAARRSAGGCSCRFCCCCHCRGRLRQHPTPAGDGGGNHATTSSGGRAEGTCDGMWSACTCA